MGKLRCRAQRVGEDTARRESLSQRSVGQLRNQGVVIVRGQHLHSIHSLQGQHYLCQKRRSKLPLYIFLSYKQIGEKQTCIQTPQIILWNNCFLNGFPRQTDLEPSLSSSLRRNEGDTDQVVPSNQNSSASRNTIKKESMRHWKTL